MKMAPIPPLRSRFAALAPANLRDTLNRHPRAVRTVALAVILLVVANLAGWTAPLKRFFTRHTVWRIDRPLAHCPVHFVTAMVSDGQGGAWIAGEDSGIYHYLPGWPSHWQHYDQGNSPGLISNHIYSLCLDAKGRLWAGTLRHGVCVFNGAQWKHYGLLNGPLGSHITAIVSDPYNKSVWMCTEAGVSIYETGKHTWRYLPQAIPGRSDDSTANGLPPHPDSVAFNQQGVAFVGTQCNGLAIGDPPYRNWTVTQGPRKMPITPSGQGLPSNLINEVLAGNHGRIYVATDAGLAWNSRHHNPYLFHYEQGADYAARVRGLWHSPANFKMPPQSFLRTLPSGDHINCLAQDAAGKLWLGTWRSGCWTDALYRGGPLGHLPEHVLGLWRFGRFDVSAILPLADGRTLVGHYGVGVSVAHFVSPSPWSRMAVAVKGWAERLLPSLWHAGLPEPAKAPTSRQLAALYQNLLNNTIPRKSAGPRVVPVTDDWRTQGSWLGRYGRYWACLFACCSSPPDFVWSPASITLDDFEQIGPHHAKGDSVRYWVQWLATKKKRVLELPEIYLDSRVLMHLTTWQVDRRESEIDDHGEAYPTTWQGPDLYVYLHIPPGTYTLSLYFFNKDGHSQKNRNRDYVVSMLPLAASYHFGTALGPSAASLARMHGTARSRVVNFSGGVWKRFLVRGPMKLAIRVAKNYSLDTILQAVMLDPLSQHPAPYYYGRQGWWVHEKQRRKFRTKLVAGWQSQPLPDDPPATARDGGLATARQIIQILNVLEHRDPAVWAANQRFACGSILRWCLAKYGANLPTSRAAVVAEKCYYRLSLFRRWEALEKSRRIVTSRQIEKGLRWDRWRDPTEAWSSARYEIM